MVEGEGLARLVPLQHQLCQLFVLIHDNFQISRRQTGRIALGADHRLHAQLAEAQIQHGLDILQKIGVGMGEGTAHIVVLAASLFHELLELGHDLLPAAVTCVVHTEPIMDFLAAVQTQDHIAAFLISPLDDVVIHQHAVGGQGEAEILPPLLLNTAGVCHQILHHLEVHQRLAAEEVHFQIAAGAGIFHQEVQGALAHLEAHDGPVAVVLALAGEAVGAIQVAGVGNVQAQGLHNASGLLLQLACHGCESIGSKQLAGFLQGHHLIVALRQIGSITGGILFRHGRQDCLPVVCFKHADDVVGDLVHHMHAAGANVQHDIEAAQFILMNHIDFSFTKNAAETGGISVYAITCSRRSGLRCRSWSCKRTGKRSGTHRSRRS